MSEANASPPLREGRGRPRRLGLVIAGMIAVAASCGLIGWAAGVVLTPAEDPLDATPYTYVEVAPGVVGASTQLNSSAEWVPTPAGENRAIGVVTSVSIEPGSEVSQGSVLYTVGLRPVAVAQGAVPAFRSIGPGTWGPDVAQLQSMLTAIGLYRGVPDGRSGPDTVAAITSWQRSQALPETGVVEVGDVIFIPSLPARVVLDDEVVARGSTLAGEEDVVRVLTAAPIFTLPVTEAQAGMIPEGTRVEMTSPDGDTWVGFAAAQKPDPQAGTMTVVLDGDAGGVICGDQCDQVPVAGRTLMLSRVITVPESAGLVVPSAALVTDARGDVAVVNEDGDLIVVTVIASARGMSVIEGPSEGILVRVPADASQ